MPAVPLGVDGFPIGWPEDYGYGSLGWDILAWGNTYLTQPDGNSAGNPWDWTHRQLRFIVWFYAVDNNGVTLFDRGQLVLPKGSGKSPFAAALACGELGAPVVFDGWNERGEAVGRPHPSPHIQLAAVSHDQTANTMSLVLPMLRDGRAEEALPGLDLGLTRVFTRNGKLEPVAASAPSREGQRLTFAVVDEPHLMTSSNGGTRLAATIRRNLGKMEGRHVETTNTWRAGEGSVAEETAKTADEVAAGRNSTKILRMHPRAVVPDMSDDVLLRAELSKLYADSPWINIDRIISEINDLSNSPGDMRRFYLNEVTTADDALVRASEYDACRVDEGLKEGDTITLGFDGGRTDDSTALVACRMEDRLFEPIGIWERPPRTAFWEIDRESVDEAVKFAFERYKVIGFFADVALWESYIDAWANRYRNKLQIKASSASAIGWDMRSRLREGTMGTERLFMGIRDGSVKWCDKPRHAATLRQHVLNARERVNNWGTSFQKETPESPNKVDGFAAMQLADMARHNLYEAGWKPRSGVKSRIYLID